MRREPAPIVVVFDGPASAGKTSNLKRLAEVVPVERRSELLSPDEVDGETQTFEWLHLDAAPASDGETTAALLLAVPKHGSSQHRRRALLELADAVVFVVDSAPRRLRWAGPMFRELPKRFGPDADQRIVIQANKQDLGDALGPEAVASHLTRTIPVIGACAMTGAGVVETLATAVTYALRYRARGPRISPAPTNPDELMEYLAATTKKMRDRSKTLVPTGPAGRPTRSLEGQPRPLKRPSGTAITPIFPPRSEPPLDDDERQTEPLRSYSGEVPVNFVLPTGNEPTPQLWPAVKARQWLKSLEQPLHFAKVSSGDVEGLVDDARYRTHERWRWDDLLTAKLALRARAEAAVKLGDAGPERQALVLVEDGDRGHRMWMLSPATPPLIDRLHEAERSLDAMSSAGLLVQLVGALVESDRRALEDELIIDADMSNYVVDGNRLRYVGTCATKADRPLRIAEAAHRTYAMLSPMLRAQWLDALAGAFGSLTPAQRDRFGLESATPNRDSLFGWLMAESAQDVG